MCVTRCRSPWRRSAADTPVYPSRTGPPDGGPPTADRRRRPVSTRTDTAQRTHPPSARRFQRTVAGPGRAGRSRARRPHHARRSPHIEAGSTRRAGPPFSCCIAFSIHSRSPSTGPFWYGKEPYAPFSTLQCLHSFPYPSRPSSVPLSLALLTTADEGAQGRAGALSCARATGRNRRPAPEQPPAVAGAGLAQVIPPHLRAASASHIMHSELLRTRAYTVWSSWSLPVAPPTSTLVSSVKPLSMIGRDRRRATAPAGTGPRPAATAGSSAMSAAPGPRTVPISPQSLPEAWRGGRGRPLAAAAPPSPPISSARPGLEVLLTRAKIRGGAPRYVQTRVGAAALGRRVVPG